MQHENARPVRICRCHLLPSFRDSIRQRHLRPHELPSIDEIEAQLLERRQPARMKFVTHNHIQSVGCRRQSTWWNRTVFLGTLYLSSKQIDLRARFREEAAGATLFASRESAETQHSSRGLSALNHKTEAASSDSGRALLCLGLRV